MYFNIKTNQRIRKIYKLNRIYRQMKRNVVLLLFLSFLGVVQLYAQDFSQILFKMDGESCPKEISLITATHGEPIKYAFTTVSPDKTCGFLIASSPQSSFYYIYDGSRYFRVCLHAKNVIRIGWHDGKFFFIDPGNKENDVLRQWNQLEDKLTCERPKNYADFFIRFDSVRREADGLINHLRKLNSAFVRQATDMIEIDLFRHFIVYLNKNQRSYDSEEQQSAYYQKIMSRFPETSDRLLSQPDGMRLLKNYFDYKQTFIYRQQQFSLDDQLKEIIDPNLREEYILHRVPMTNYADFRQFEEKYFPLLSVENRRRLCNDVPRPQSELEKGKPAPNFIYEDSAGKLHSLSELRGNYVYIDIWATWCMPCKAEIPHLERLEKKFAQAKIKFVSISIDQKKDIWKRFVNEKQLGGLQLWAGDWTQLPKELNLGSVPRFLLIDPEGNWVNSNADRPSNPNLDQFLTELVNR